MPVPGKSKPPPDLSYLSPLVDASFLSSIEPFLRAGDLVSIAHVLRYLFLNRWRRLAAELQEKRYVLFACNEKRFIESVYAVAQQEFLYEPRTSLDELLSPTSGATRLAFLQSFVQLCERSADGRKTLPAPAPRGVGVEKWVPLSRSPGSQQRLHDEWLPGDSSPQRYLAFKSSRESADDLSEPSDSSSRLRAVPTLGGNPSTDSRISRLETTLYSEISRIEVQLQRLTALVANQHYSPPISPSSTSTDTNRNLDQRMYPLVPPASKFTGREPHKS